MKRVFAPSAQLYFFACAFTFIIINSCTVNNESKIVLSSDFPDYQINYSGDIDYIQSQFDKEMWKTFVALSWPADNLKPIANGNILDNYDARSVFENYSFNYDLFLLNARDNTKFEPVGWGEFASLDQQRQTRWKKWHEHDRTYCADLVEKAKSKGITNMAEIIPLDEFIQASNDPKPHVPQIDKAGNFVWSSVIYNEVTYDFVVNNKYYSADGIRDAKSIANVHEEVVHHIVPENKDTFFNQMVNSLEDSPGAMHLKTSWKILKNDDEELKFHTAWGATLFNNMNFTDSTTWEPQCSLVKVGLVGMHIAVKTKDQPDFIWATFEHIDNCPEVGKIDDKDYTFYDSLSTLQINKVPLANQTTYDTIYKEGKIQHIDTLLWFNPKGRPIGPSQVVREIPIPKETKALNNAYREALENSVWANYQLVGSQWTDPKTQKVYPKLLSNTTLETFDQSGSSCIGCHHQVTANTLKYGPNNDQYTMAPFHIGNVLNVRLNLLDGKRPAKVRVDTAVYSDYMYSLLKWTEFGHLTWKQI